MAFKDPLLNAVSNLCKRRGYIFPTSTVYGGLEGRYEYGPLGSLLKRNIAKDWWNTTVTSKENAFGMDSSIVQHPRTWQTSGHATVFGDKMATSLLTGNSLKVSKAPKISELDSRLEITAPSKNIASKWRKQIRSEFAPGIKMFTDGSKICLSVESVTDSHILFSGEDGPVHVAHHGILCPETNSPFLTEPKLHGGMFYSSTVSAGELAESFLTVMDENRDAPRAHLKKLIEDKYMESSRPLRPELAQSAFQQFRLLHHSVDRKFPMSVAQIGKAFRNEHSCGPFIYRLMEFEQMECYHFVNPEASERFALDLSVDRLSWWRSLARKPSNFKFVELEEGDRAHYASTAIDIEYSFPWGSEEVESIADRTDFDLKAHAEAASIAMTHTDGTTSFTPHCVEASAGLDRAIMAYLCDAYDTREVSSSTVNTVKPYLKLDKRIAPIKVAVFPIVHNNAQLVQIAKLLAKEFRTAGLYTMCSENASIGKRYVDHDEMGTPYCITVDDATIEKGTVTVRSRDTCIQEPMLLTDVVGSLLAYYKT